MTTQAQRPRDMLLTAAHDRVFTTVGAVAGILVSIALFF